ncbi:DNA-binding LacI/PurR family transcriptional regulator [Microbacterium endophyticum]|uniref:DNA-binding LacI/PurR family transcriptional regulator n=1 Tax=Microbacterium endophyticum TaxID=1526412 RepID=A0A7W4V3Y0_9MICO|nr:LacI family DNA-binding transcriptional regulator [Microbacterium endophyticum]MBB2976412.1 DNA-binding LacI/PurR family transcriptional regulator [Microbacterium endophyticum]NIK35858.1 DNA-binding LacI/PurR family transcriptional regulator [Microbacterium endophyticum]
MVSASKAAGATLRDIANEVGISVSAVSMALRDHPRIGPETKARVLSFAEELGYVPNSAGRALRAQKADAVALIVPNTSQHVFGHSYFMHVLTGVTAVANHNDAQVVISTNPDESHGMTAYERVMRSGRVDGAIVTSAAVTDDNIERLVHSGLPLVLLGNFPYLPDSVSVGVDDRAAAFEATSHLIQIHQRRTLAHISGPLDHQSAIDRRDGFFDAIEAHGVEGSLLVGDYSEESGAHAVGDITAIDGVVAANDEMAFGAMTRLRQRGLTAPREISIIGFDDFGLSRVTTPSITTMHVPAERMARLATERLFDIVSGVAIAQDDARVTLPVNLVARESCGC